MGSQWFSQSSTGMNNSDDINAEKKIDLTLKLGLPNSADQGNQHPANLNIDAHNYHQGAGHYQGMNNFPYFGQSLNPSEVAWPPSNFGTQFSHAAQGQHMYSNNGYSFSSFPGPPSSMAAPPPPMREYTLIDVPSTRRVDHHQELGFVGSSSSAAAAGSPQRGAAANMRRQNGVNFNVDPFRRCTNYNCNTNNTPMWRKGPLGPKTLCNACGIKYRKEEEKRKAKEANKSNEDQEDSNNTPSTAAEKN